MMVDAQKPTKAQLRYLQNFKAGNIGALPPTGPGMWPLRNGLLASGLCESRKDGFLYITDAGRKALAQSKGADQ